MNILEKLFSKKELDVTLEPTLYSNSLYSYKNSAYVSKRVYILSIKFRVHTYGDKAIGELIINKNVQDYEIPSLNGTYRNIVETRITPKKKDSLLKTFNQLLRNCGKTYSKEYKVKGSKECLLDYLTINETEEGYELEIEKEALNKFSNY